MANVLPPLTEFKRVALDFLLPRWCIACGKEGDYICGSCRQLLPSISPPICFKCGRPQPPGKSCRGCIGEKSEIDGIRAPFLFEGTIRHAVHELKYRNLRAITSMLAGFLYEYVRENPIPADVLVPVPVHKKRERERGYNQSALLARELSRLCGIPAVEGSLVRQVFTLPQARSASAIERQRNVADVFTCRDWRLHGKKVLLIDDVSTSGATLNACTGVIKKTGAVSVWGLVLALEL
jgi:ComF family protein